MADIGKVVISQPNRTTITSPNYRPKPNVSLSEINDVYTNGVQDGFSLVYSSANSRYETKIATTVLDKLDGGYF